MKHTIGALILAAILIGGVLVLSVPRSSVGKVSQSWRDIETLSEERPGTHLNGEVTSLTSPRTLMPITATTTTTLVRAGSGEVVPGDSITVPVTAENVTAGSPVAAVIIEVRYDPSVVDATACNVDPGGIFDSGFCNPDFDNDSIDPDVVRFNATSVSGVSGNLLLANITFAAVGQPGDTSVLNVAISAFADPDGNPVPVTGQDGQICLTPCGDSDGDGVYDTVETNCGSDPNDPGSIPERIDASFLNLDDDKDTQIDEALPSPGSDGFDCDGDGYAGNEEAYVYSAASTVRDQDPCGDGTGPGPDGSNNGWPADLDGNGSMGGGDVNSFLFPTQVDDGHGIFNKFGHPVSDGADTQRWDLDGNGTVGGGDLNALNPAVAAAIARPPMLGGEVAFGQACPWP